MGSSGLLSSAHLTSCSGRPQFLFRRCKVGRSGGGAIPWSSHAFRSSQKRSFLCFSLEEDGGREPQPPPTSGTGAALQEKPSTELHILWLFKEGHLVFCFDSS
ncbi:hypothetical protein MA16_Dca018825 [Dendrobium catenatum]|uniref:Uncharacterized protein n=1 Tax=Dendrobium catenatum TaxID=906689 RepID=A0A2I0X446_9ASPA|nr:hypothetical protein MA16_Dca018825 [Dendrobium catenatum]